MNLRSEIIKHLMEFRYPKEPMSGVEYTGWVSIFRIADEIYNVPAWEKDEKIQVLRKEMLTLARENIIEKHPFQIWRDSVYRIKELV